MPYDDWVAGKDFIQGTEMREYVCPAWWYQSADYSKMPKWEECGFGSFSGCENFCNKAACWKRFDDEQNNE